MKSLISIHKYPSVLQDRFLKDFSKFIEKYMQQSRVFSNFVCQKIVSNFYWYSILRILVIFSNFVGRKESIAYTFL